MSYTLPPSELNKFVSEKLVRVQEVPGDFMEFIFPTRNFTIPSDVFQAIALQCVVEDMGPEEIKIAIEAIQKTRTRPRWKNIRSISVNVDEKFISVPSSHLESSATHTS